MKSQRADQMGKRSRAQRPGPICLATCHGARGAPQQSPILRAGTKILSCYQAQAKTHLDCSKSEKPWGFGGWPPTISASHGATYTATTSPTSHEQLRNAKPACASDIVEVEYFWAVIWAVMRLLQAIICGAARFGTLPDVKTVWFAIPRILLPDGDHAGRKAGSEVTPLLAGATALTEVIKIEHNCDLHARGPPGYPLDVDRLRSSLPSVAR